MVYFATQEMEIAQLSADVEFEVIAEDGVVYFLDFRPGYNQGDLSLDWI